MYFGGGGKKGRGVWAHGSDRMCVSVYVNVQMKGGRKKRKKKKQWHLIVKVQLAQVASQFSQAITINFHAHHH